MAQCNSCEGDFDGNGKVEIHELVTAVGNALAGCPDDPFSNADGINGGRMYDRFWAEEAGFDQNDPNIDILAAASDFFRCKQCHAWDRLGNQASYINRGPKTTRPNVSAVSLAALVPDSTPQELFDALKLGTGAPRRDVDADLSAYDPAIPASTVLGDQMPDLSQILTDEQIWDLVKYLKEEAFNTEDLYEVATMGEYPDGSRTFSDWGRGGDVTEGDALYTAKCAGCHGADGTGGAITIEDGDVTVGSHVRGKPYETWHKIKFGQVGSIMGAQGINSLKDMQDLYSALADETMYPDPQ